MAMTMQIAVFLDDAL